MENLIHLFAIRNLENAELRNRPNHRHNPQDPFGELNEKQFVKLFRLSKDLVQYLVECLSPYIRSPLRATDLDVLTKVVPI